MQIDTLHKPKEAGMLKSWSIENFKSIVNSGELKLAPVTVLAGLNSSGKSSFLQSILMISQTLGSRVLDRPLLPNGAIIQLGTVEDILSELSGSHQLKISFVLDLDEEQDPSLSRGSSANRFIIPSSIKCIKTTASFNSLARGMGSSAIESSKVSVENVRLEVTTTIPGRLLRPPLEIDGDLEMSVNATEDFTFDFGIESISRSDLDQFLEHVERDHLRLIPSYDEENSYVGRFRAKEVEQGKVPSEPYLVTLSHFLPTRFIRRYKIKENRRRFLEQIMFLLFRELSSRSIELSRHMVADLSENASLPLDKSFSENLQGAIQQVCQEEAIEAFTGQNLLELARWLKSLKEKRSRKKILEDRFKELVIQDLMESSFSVESEDAKGLMVDSNNVYVENLDEAEKEMVRFFTSKIRYLGPLRADPQSAQRFAPSSELDEVGAKGEYAAAVYDANQNARIEWYNPVKEKVEQGTLKVALDNWARYLGVANQVKIEEAGQSGVSWQIVHKKNFKPRPLSAVGVGVSQILPILVMGLLAPSNTLLIIEQPELHLHPHVQARLGDFFMGLAKCRKQCLIETHSENLVSQLRYHIVQAGGQDKSDCNIYFVDQDKKGATQFNPVEISPQGNILNWPDGFFDETMLQEDRITAASLKKRANSVKKHD